MTAAAVSIPLRVGARTILSIPRRLERVALSLDDVLAGTAPALPPLDARADGYWITSVPEERAETLGGDGHVRFVRQRYRRYRTDLCVGHDAWLAGMSANARQSLRRKARRLAGAEVRRYRTARELAEFHALARPLSAATYQEKLLDAGLPDDPGFLGGQARLASEDRVRAWLLMWEGRPAAYLWCSAEGSALRYDHLGHDPALSHLSPGTVLHGEAMRDLFAEGRFRHFDFLEGEGQHKRRFATASSSCADLLLLRATVANRAIARVVGGFDGAVERTKRWTGHPSLAGAVRRLRRA